MGGNYRVWIGEERIEIPDINKFFEALEKMGKTEEFIKKVEDETGLDNVIISLTKNGITSILDSRAEQVPKDEALKHLKERIKDNQRTLRFLKKLRGDEEKKN